MTGIITLLCTLALSLFVTRVATVALQLTGLAREVARFQARSAFSGVGFTTFESEKVVSHPVRRRIIMVLMLFGNIGIAAVVASTIYSFGAVDTEGARFQDWALRLVVFVAGACLLWLGTQSRWLDRIDELPDRVGAFEMDTSRCVRLRGVATPVGWVRRSGIGGFSRRLDR